MTGERVSPFSVPYNSEFFHSFLSLEIFSIFLFAPVQSRSQKSTLVRKNTAGAFPSPPCTHPIDAYECVNKKYIFVFIYLDFFPATSFACFEIINFLKYSYVLKHVASPRFSNFFLNMTLVSRDFPIAAESCQQHYEK